MKTIKELLQQLETAQDILSKFQLGYLYDKGELVPQDDVKAFKYYQQAATIDVQDHQNNLDIKYKGFAIYNVGIMHFYGRGVQENKQQAFVLLQKAAETGNSEANWRLGQMYQHGEGVAQNIEKAHEHYLLAANQSNATAQFNLGKMYFEGFQAKMECELYLMLSSTFYLQYGNNLDPIKNKLPLVIFDQNKQPIKLFILNKEGDIQKVDLLQNTFPRELLQQFIYEYYSLGHGLLQQNSPILEWLTSQIGHTTKNNEEAQKWFKKAVEGGHSQAKYFLEDWPIIISHSERNSDNKPLITFTLFNLKKIVNLCKNLLSVNNEFSFERDIGENYCFGQSLDATDRKVKFFLQMIAFRGNMLEWYYSVGRYYFNKSSEEIKRKEYCSKDRIHDSFGFAKLYLTKALDCGVKKAKKDLQSLEDLKKGAIEVKTQCWGIEDCGSCAPKAHFTILDDIVDLLKANSKYNTKQAIRQATIPAEHVEYLLSNFIKNGNIEEYKAWTSCVLDEKSILDIVKHALNEAIELKKIGTAKKLLSLETIDINYLIENLNMSPLEVMIEQGDADLVKTLLDRPNVDVNFNKPLLKAIKTKQNKKI